MAKTIRGFELQYFKDDYNVECSIQESSSIDPHVWLGVHDAKIRIMSKERDNIIISKDDPTTEQGWCTIQLPKEAYVESRMHLNRKQAKELAKKLEYFARHGCLKEE